MAKKLPDLRRDLACPDCAGAAFSLLLLKDDGIGVAQCAACARHYLLLDSGDYWFDAIQQRYPSPAKCTCRSTTFGLRADYWRRDDGDVRAVQLWSTCTQCAKTARRLSLDIDYGDTEELVDVPLHFCARPKLLYDLRQLHSYAPAARIAALVRHLHEREHCTFFASVREDGQWVPRALGAEEAVTRVRDSEPGELPAYHWLYAMPAPIDVPAEEIGHARAEAAWWKRNEVIRISAPFSIIQGEGRTSLYYIGFANECVEGDAVRPKSEVFRATTARLLAHLSEHFVSWRGADSFDDVGEHRRAFGERFRKATL